MTEQQFINEHKEFGNIDLTDKESGKLKGMPFPGATVHIYWDVPDNIIDVGYLFLLPFGDKDIDDYFVNVLKPENPYGKESSEPEWSHINKLLKNELCKMIEVISSEN